MANQSGLPGAFPMLLEDGSRLDWNAATYNVSVVVSGSRAKIEHTLVGSSSLVRSLEEGRASFAVELRCPKTLTAWVETSSNSKQAVEWNSDHVDGDVYLIPGIIAVAPLTLDDAELNKLWTAAPLEAPAGWWIARGVVRRASSLLRSLVTFRRDNNLEKGRMQVRSDRSSGQLRFTVALAPDVYPHIRTSRTLMVAALIGVCAQFPREFDREEGEEEEPVAREIRERVVQADPDLSLWGDDSYDPANLATVIERLRFEEANDDQ